MLVLDASALVTLATGQADARLRERFDGAQSFHAPHLIDAEVMSALRQLAFAKVISQDRASDSLRLFRGLKLERYPHRALLSRMWELRDNFNPYDASYIALAEALGVPLVTRDRKLRKGHNASVEVYA